MVMFCKVKKAFLTIGNLIFGFLLCWSFFTLKVGMKMTRNHGYADGMNDTVTETVLPDLRNISSWRLKSLKLKMKHHIQHQKYGGSNIHARLSKFSTTRKANGVMFHRPQSASNASFSMKRMVELCEKYQVPTMNVIRGDLEKQCIVTSRSNHTLSSRGFWIQHSRNTKSSQVQQSQPLGCVISHKYQFIYIHVLKSGGMSMKAFLKEALCGSMTLPCEAGLDMLQVGKCTDALSQYPNYFVWSFARNPYSRLYSLYAMSLTMLTTRGKQMETSKRIHENNAKNPKRNKRTLVDRHRQLKMMSGESGYSFENFVIHSDQRRDYSYLHYGHYRPQSIFLFDEDECPLVDFIGRLEHLGQDLPFLLERLGSPELLEYARMRNWTLGHDMNTAYGKRKRDSEQKSLLEYFNSDRIKLATMQEFESDFRLLGYEPNFVPEEDS